MEFVLLLSMLLFIGFCAAILGLAIFDVYGEKSGKKPIEATTKKRGLDRNTECQV